MNIKRIKYDLPLKIDLGSGEHTKDGFTGVDIKDCGQGVVWDITQGLPFPDNSVEEIYSSHFIEHIEDKHLITLVNEIVRVCKNGAIVFFKCPEKSHIEAYYKSHLSLWDEKKVRGVFFGEANNFEFLKLGTEGIEIYFKLKVNK